MADQQIVIGSVIRIGDLAKELMQELTWLTYVENVKDDDGTETRE